VVRRGGDGGNGLERRELDAYTGQQAGRRRVVVGGKRRDIPFEERTDALTLQPAGCAAAPAVRLDAELLE